MKTSAIFLRTFGFALLCAGLSYCGTEPKPASTVQSVPQGVEVNAKVLPGTSVNFLYSNNHYLEIKAVESMSVEALEEKLASIGVVPTRVPQFFHADLKIDRFEGCSPTRATDYYIYCRPSFTFTLEIKMAKGAEELDNASIRVPIEPSADLRGSLRKAIRWSVGHLVDKLAERGGFAEIAVETPYY